MLGGGCCIRDAERCWIDGFIKTGGTEEIDAVGGTPRNAGRQDGTGSRDPETT